MIKFKYGQWTVTIEVLSFNPFEIGNYWEDLFCKISCVGTLYSVNGTYYGMNYSYCVYDTPELLSRKLKDKIYNSCRKLLHKSGVPYFSC